MSEVAEVTIDGIPLSWRAPYVGSRGAYSPRTAITRDFKEVLKAQYTGEPFEGAVRLVLFCYMPIPKSTSKKKRALMLSGAIRPTISPDLSNCVKLYEDILQGIVICNDRQVVENRCEKWYDERPRVYMRIEEL